MVLAGRVENGGADRVFLLKFDVAGDASGAIRRLSQLEFRNLPRVLWRRERVTNGRVVRLLALRSLAVGRADGGLLPVFFGG